MTERESGASSETQINTDTMGVRLDYAWKWFEFHARQRVTMFSFFLIGSGILANAYVAAVVNGPWYAAFAIGVAGALASVSFIALDCRNRSLLGLAEDVLADTERRWLFVGGADKQEDSTGGLAGILKRESDQDRKASWCRRTLGKHKWWIRLMELMVGLVFAAAAVLAWVSPGAP